MSGQQHAPVNLYPRERSGIVRLKRDGTRAETRFGLSAKRTSPFKSAGVSVQSTAGSRGVRISGQQLYSPCSYVQCKTTGYPLHSHISPSLPLPCVTVCHQVLNALCPFYRRLGGPEGRSGRAENLVPTGIRSRTVQPVVSRYTDWATGPHIIYV